jgi:hypothetical protein
MSARKNIEKQLAEAQNAWDEQPVPELWSRLEAELDAAAPASEGKKPKNWPFRILMALLLPVGIGLWFLLAGPSDAKAIAKAIAARDHAVHVYGPAISLSEELDQQVHSGLDFGNNFALGHARPGLSGKPTLFPKPAVGLRGMVFQPATSGNVAVASTNMNPAGNPGDAVALSSPTTNYMGYTPQSYNSYPPRFGNLGNENLNIGLPDGNLLVTNGNGNPLDTVHSLTQYSDMPQSSNTYLQLNTRRNDMHFDLRANGRNPHNISGLQELNWLLGSWKTEGFSGAGYEEWVQKDAFTIEGKGYLVVNGDTLVTEQMRIEQQGPAVYYIVVKDTAHKAMRFRLRSQQSNELIFQNEAPKSNQEIVIRGTSGQVEKILQTPPRTRNPFSNPSIAEPVRPEAVRILRR